MENPSLDSLASSIHILSDHDPTVTLDHSSTPRPPLPSGPYRSHRPTASTSTARPFPPSQQTTPRSRLPRASHPPPSAASSPSSARRSLLTDDDLRSTTPSLTEDSLNSLTAGEELATESDTEDERTQVALAQPVEQFDSSGGSRFSGLKSVTGSKKWRFGRGGKDKEEKKEREKERDRAPSRSSGIFGRRTGPREPEVMVIDRDELERDQTFDAVRSRLPRSSRPGDGNFVVLGQRTRTSTGTTGTGSSGASAIPQRVKHSSAASTARSTSSGERSTSNPPLSRPHRSSLHFAPLTFNPEKRRASVASSCTSPTSPSGCLQPSWREYDSMTSEDGGETTGADMSEFSGDDAPPSGRRLTRGRGGAHRQRRSGRSTGAGAITPSTSFMTASARSVSPVESILGGDKSRWNASQVSFASSASAFALRQSSADRGADCATVQGRKRKLTKKRPDAIDPSQHGEAQRDLLAGEPPLLSPSSLSFSSSTSGSRPESSRTVQSRSRQHRQAPSLPFAQDSGGEDNGGRRRTVRQRSVTSPEHQDQHRRHALTAEKGQVIELSDDQEWLGVIPFPPSPRASIDRSGGPRLPYTPSRTSLRSPGRILRKISGAEKTSSHPPVTARTQAEAKASKRGSSLGSSLSNILSRSTSALPLAGKRAPSPAPSAKSSKSSKSILSRRTSEKRRKGKEKDASVADDEDAKTLPKSPSLGLLRKRNSAVVSPLPSSRSSTFTTSPSASTSSSRLPSPNSAETPKLPPSESAFSFFRPRGFSRSTTKHPSPPSPVKSSIPRPSAFEATSGPLAAHSRSSMVRSRPSTSLADAAVAQPVPPVPRGQLNQGFKMPRQAAPRPHSTISTVSTTSGSTGSYASTLMPLGGYRDAAVGKAMRSQNGPPASGSSPPHEHHERPRTAMGGERPPTSYFFDDDLAISEADFSLPRRNSLSDLRIPARVTGSQKKIQEDLERVKQFAQGIEDLKTLKRQYDQLIQVFVDPPAASDLLSPAEVTSRPSSAVLAKTAAAIRRVELDYSQWWEQAQTLINLGDGKEVSQPQRESPGAAASRRDRCISLAPEKTPSKHRAASGSETETEATHAALGHGRPEGRGTLLRSVTSPTGRRIMQRQASTSSIATELSVEQRQREMLRGVLAPALKGASLPSRGPPSPRPGLSVITQPADPPASRTPSAEKTPSRGLGDNRIPLGVSHTVSPTTPRAKPPPRVRAVSQSRRVSRVGVFGIREFLLRLRSKATEELAASVGTLPLEAPAHPPSCTGGVTPSRRSVSDPASRPSAPSAAHTLGPSSLNPAIDAGAATSRRLSTSSSSSSGSDWDADLSPPRNSLLFGSEVGSKDSSSFRRRRARAQSALSVAEGGGVSVEGGGGKGKMILTTEAMPSLLQKVKEVKEACEACVGLLKGLTL
ncbi:hypothetical protein JCM10213v2_000951 [Rhodosporidiobolus nylandii]